jgi:hypothetical protein
MATPPFSLCCVFSLANCFPSSRQQQKEEDGQQEKSSLEAILDCCCLLLLPRGRLEDFRRFRRWLLAEFIYT